MVISFDGALAPSPQRRGVNWPGPDGKSIDAFTREPHPAHDPQTFFNLAYHLHQAIAQDSAPTVALAPQGRPGRRRLRRLLALVRPRPRCSAPWTGLGRYFADAHYRRLHSGPRPADDFFADYLDDRVTNRHRPDPVSGFARHLGCGGGSTRRSPWRRCTAA